MSTSNPVLDFFEGIEIRKYNRLVLHLDQKTFKEIISLQKSTGLSSRKILGYSSKPCSHCADSTVIAYNRNDDEVIIPRGLLSKRIPSTHSGNNKIEHNAKGNKPDKKD